MSWIGTNSFVDRGLSGWIALSSDETCVITKVHWSIGIGSGYQKHSREIIGRSIGSVEQTQQESSDWEWGTHTKDRFVAA